LHGIGFMRRFCRSGKLPFVATVKAMAVMGIAGEMAASVAAGPGSLQTNFLDNFIV